MKKVLIEGLIGFLVMIAIFFAMGAVPWLEIFSTEEKIDSLEERVGDFLWNSINSAQSDVPDSTITKPIDSLVTAICSANDIDKSRLKVHVVENSMENAFALPGRHLVIFTGLIRSAEDQAELSGVICHEIAHIELRHVMKKLLKEVGFSALSSMVGGNHTGAEVSSKALEVLSSAAFDRSMEEEADLEAVSYMINARIDPIPFANLLYRLSVEHGEKESSMSWISTHPESADRANDIIKYAEEASLDPVPVLSPETWQAVKERIEQH